MTKKLYPIFILLVLFFMANIVNAEENFLTFSSTNTYNTKNISNVISHEEGYIFTIYDTNNTTIYKYDQDNNLKSSKQLENFKNSKIIKYGSNILVSGITENVLKIYLLDSNLQIKNQLKTSYIISQTTDLNLYNYNNKIYLMLTEDGILSNNNIYEIDENLNIFVKSLSSLGSTTIKDILKGDYYLVHFNSNIEENSENNSYIATTYLENQYILVGKRTYDIDSKEYGLLTIVDQSGSKIYEEVNDKYDSYQAVNIVKDKIIILAIKEESSFILTYNFEGNLLNEDVINNEITYNNITNMYKVANKVVFATSTQLDNLSEESYLMFYNYNLSINKEDSIYGTLQVENTALPYSKVKFEIVPNSGYEIDNVIVKDTQGKLIDIFDNSFIMPENDVTLLVTYKEIVANPETIDLIVLTFVSVLVISLITYRLYKKMSWLK